MTDIDAIRKRDAEFALDLISPHPWQMATSCSFRRVIDAQGREIIGGTVQHSDGHPDMYFANRGYQGPDATLLIEAPQIAADRRALRIAYDAKCEELANACALGASLSSDLDAALIRISQLESRLRADLEHIRPLELGALSAFEQKYDAMRAERDAAHREKAAAMGLVEGHALTIAKLEAERDAAVRDAQRYRWLRDGGSERDFECSGPSVWINQYIPAINEVSKNRCEGARLDLAIDSQLAAFATPAEQTKVML